MIHLRKTNEQGNIFLVLFSGIAVLGLLGVTVTSFMKGPMTSAMKLTRANTAQVQMGLASQASIMAATNTATAGDCDADGYIEPMEWRIDGTKPKPTGGNLLPSNIGVPTADAWGTDYGYCVWDHGPTSLNAGCQQTSPGTDKRLAGTNSRKYPVVAVISAGPDKTFSSTCRTFAAADVNSNGVLGDSGDYALAQKDAVTSDDLIFTYTYEEASSASGGLWTLKSSDQTTAVIPKKIEAQQARFTGTSTMNSIGVPPAANADCTGLGTPYYNDAVSGHCYFYSTSGNQAAAAASCASNGAYLASITSASEQAIVTPIITANAWLGASYGTTWDWNYGELAGLGFWTGNQSGSAISSRYNNWNSGEPQTTYTGVKISVGGTWSDQDPTTSMAGLCEKEPIYQADCSGLGSSYYNDPVTGHCYFTTTATTWSGAKAACTAASSDAYLATITSSGENTRVVANIDPGSDMHIGSSDSAVEGEWRWDGGDEAGMQFWSGDSTGSAYGGAYTNWGGSGTQPSTVNASYDYGKISHNSYMWVTDGTNIYPGLCERSASGQSVEFTNGLKIADSTVVTTCNADNTGVVRAGATGPEICDGAAWNTMGSGAKMDSLSDAYIDDPNYSMYLGASAGDFAAPGHFGNTGVGTGGVMQALYSGGFDTSLGYKSMGILTGGWGNTAIGSLAMSNVLTADRNTALGHEACRGSGAVLASSYQDNTCLGWRTANMYASSGVTLVGANAGRLNQGTTRLTAIGYSAATNNYGGLDNTGVGYQAIYYNQGDNNTAIGLQALYNMVNDDNNTAIGYKSLWSHYNNKPIVTLGSEAGYNADGTNIFAGYRAGYNVSGQYTNIIGLGYQSMYGPWNLSIGVGSYAGYNSAGGGGARNIMVGADAAKLRGGGSDYLVALGYDTLNIAGTVVGNVAVGSGAQKNATATYGVSVGYQALYNQATSGNIIAVGYQALFSSTTGGANTAIGHQALYKNNGDNNTAAGYQALYNTSSANNSALGYQALYTQTTGASNSAAGYQSLYKLLSGNYNTAAGYQALYNTINHANTAIGYRAGYSGTSIYDTLNVGYQAGYANNYPQNTFVGAEAGYGMTSSILATAVGYRAMYSNTGANHGNTAIGYQALMKGVDGSDSAINSVGFGAGAGETSISSNTTAFGALALNQLNNNGLTLSPDIVAVGAGAGRWAEGNGTTISMTALGFQALHSGRTAGGTAAGAQALFTNAGSSTNVALGYRALYSQTASSGLTAIGSRALYSSVSGNNATVIGYDAVGGGLDTIRIGNDAITLIEGTVAFTNPSDRRLKKDIRPSDLGLDFILGLKPVSYRLKQGNGRIDYGFLAQDIDSLLYKYGHGDKTNMITRLPDTEKTYQLRSADLIAPITKAIQERQVKIEALKRELDELKKNEPVACEGERL